ncbi:MAG: GTPase Era [Thermodesulfobacteriota bacterium]
METEAYRSGYIAIVGRPNVGKSTLLNKLLGYRVAITSPKPQTTRNRILGIKTLPGAQMLFVDTPGIHKAERPLNRYMTKEAMRALSDVDVILLLIEADGSSSEDDAYIIGNLRETKTPVLLVINKIDSVPKPSLLSLMDRYATLYPFQALIPASALTGDGLDILEKEIIRLLPPGPQYFPEDQVTDVPERFLASELVREKVFNMCGEEIPYAVAVVVEEFKERTPPKPVYIKATVYVEKESQKGILIGAQGRMLKKIGQAAREDLQGILGRPVYLELWVKVEKNWSRDERGLRKMGYR